VPCCVRVNNKHCITTIVDKSALPSVCIIPANTVLFTFFQNKEKELRILIENGPYQADSP